MPICATAISISAPCIVHAQQTNSHSIIIAKEGEYEDYLEYKNCIKGLPKSLVNDFIAYLEKQGVEKSTIQVEEDNIHFSVIDKFISIDNFTGTPKGYEKVIVLPTISSSQDKKGNGFTAVESTFIYKPTKEVVEKMTVNYRTSKVDAGGFAETKSVVLEGKEFFTDRALTGDFESKKVEEGKFKTTYIGQGTNCTLPTDYKGMGKIQKGWTYNDKTNTFTTVYEETGLGVENQRYRLNILHGKKGLEWYVSELETTQPMSFTMEKENEIIEILLPKQPSGTFTYTLKGQNHYVGELEVSKDKNGDISYKYTRNGTVRSQGVFATKTYNYIPTINLGKYNKDILETKLHLENKDKIDLGGVSVIVKQKGDLYKSVGGAMADPDTKPEIAYKDGELVARTYISEDSMANFSMYIGSPFAEAQWTVEFDGLPDGYEIKPFTIEFSHSEDKIMHYYSVNGGEKVECGQGSSVNTIGINISIMKVEKPEKPQPQPKPQPEPKPEKPQPQAPTEKEVSKGMPTGVQTNTAPLVIAGVVVAVGAVVGGYKLYKKHKNK